MYTKGGKSTLAILLVRLWAIAGKVLCLVDCVYYGVYGHWNVTMKRLQLFHETFRIEEKLLYNDAVKFTRWHHPAICHVAQLVSLPSAASA